MTKTKWPPVLSASFPQPPHLVDEYSGLVKGDKFKVKGESATFRFVAGDPQKDHLYCVELDRNGSGQQQRCFEGKRLRKKVK